MDYTEIGRRIRKFRKARGFSQEELAEMAGISTVHMSHIETGGTKLSLPVFVDLAAALEVSTDELLFDAPDTGKIDTLAEIAQTLDSCTAQQTRVLRDILKATRDALNKYL